MNQQTTTSQTSVLAILSLIFSCCGLCIPGIICGHIANRKIKNNPSLKGTGLVIAGLIVGYLALVVVVVHIILFVLLASIIIFEAPQESKEITVEMKSCEPKEIIYIKRNQ